MNNFFKYLIFISLLFFLSGKANATHVRAGELIFWQISEKTYEIQLITYTDSKGIDRREVEINFGDNTTETVPRSEKTYLGNEVIKNVYRTTHTFPGCKTYVISHMDRNRNAYIVNIDNSVNTAFYIETELYIPCKGGNRSPLLLQPPIDFGCTGHIFVHNPNAYDPDGDSLRFSLITPRQDKNMDVFNYRQPPAPNDFTLNPATGQLIWDYPAREGDYNIAILIEEYRNGKRIGSVVRDMQIIVKQCVNNPPVIAPIPDTCVEAGSPFTLNIPLHATDADAIQTITMTASGGPFVLPSSNAVLSPNPAKGSGIVNAKFIWTAACNHIRKEPYQVVIKAVDNHASLPLADLKPFFIRVVGPAPRNLSVSPTIKGMQLNWQPPPYCSNAKRYNIYRRADSSFWDTTRCETGVPYYTGFRLIDSIIIDTSLPGNESYFDDNHGKGLVPGVTYCYRVTAIYLNNGNYELAEGYASNEACASLMQDYPVITHASVRVTHSGLGSVYIDWEKGKKLDTILFKPPYIYKIYHSSNFGGKGPVLIDSIYSPSFYQLVDSSKIDTLLSTSYNPYSYLVELYCTDSAGLFLLGKTQYASTIYLSLAPTHRSMVLTWQENVPWYNDHYIIYRKNDVTSLFDSIGTAYKQHYKDTGLVNGKSYCYKVESYGFYLGTSEFVNPIRNFSQYQCASPRDTFDPCPPTMRDAEAFCPDSKNNIRWNFDSHEVCDSDVVAYKIYFRERLTNEYRYVATVSGYDSNTYIDGRPELVFSQAGCYVVSAIDKYNNESGYSNELCVDNCPNYIIPNVFTPNGDNINDVMRPLEGSMHIEKINMRIFNRWGQLVFQTTDSNINWDGKDMDSKEDCSPGTYFYICEIDKMYLEGNKSVKITGTVTLIR